MITAIDQYVIDAIRKERRSQKISQAMLAHGIGVSKGFIGQIERPSSIKRYNLIQINEIAKFLCCSPRQFLPEDTL